MVRVGSALTLLAICLLLSNCGFIRGGKKSSSSAFSLSTTDDTVPDKCLQPQDKGSCKGTTPVYGFDLYSKTCTSFAYSGCGGNSNRFATLAECQSTCEEKGIDGYVGYDVNHVLVHCPIPPKDLQCGNNPKHPEDDLPAACRKIEGQVSRCGCHYFLCTDNEFKVP